MTPEGSARDREIVSARVIVTCPGRNFVTLRIETRSGIVGLGDATLNGRELAVAAYLQEHIVPSLIGRDAGRIEDTWQFFYRGAYWRRGPVTMTAIAAVDVALWDIVATLANMPLYQLLGGRSRQGALVYGHANGRDLAQTSDEVRRHIEMGFLAVRAQCAVPSL
jgi:mannonate dehydratase